MSNKERMLEKLKTVEQLSATSKAGRLMHHPFRYLYAIALKNFIYPVRKKEKQKRIKIFTGKYMNILLPSSTDIYLTGGKSHNSELRLAKFLIRTLEAGDHFLDIGAHYGYFTLLANEIVGATGKLKAIEPASGSVSVLKKNCSPYQHIEVIQKAIAEQAGEISFYEFPNLFSEYNSINDDQFKNKKWFAEFSPSKTIVETISVNDLTKSRNFIPRVIKIDVEGAELKVIQGGLDFFSHHDPVIAMEYLTAERDNTPHEKAVDLLRAINYKTFVIDRDGYLQEVTDIGSYLAQNNMESDNIILRK